jgi:hypothetical protein
LHAISQVCCAAWPGWARAGSHQPPCGPVWAVQSLAEQPSRRRGRWRARPVPIFPCLQQHRRLHSKRHACAGLPAWPRGCGAQLVAVSFLLGVLEVGAAPGRPSAPGAAAVAPSASSRALPAARSLVVVGTSTFAARARVAIGTAAASATALSFVDNGSARRSPPFPPRRAVAFGDAERADARNRGAAAAVSTRRESWTGAGGTAASPPAKDDDQRRSHNVIYSLKI